MEFCTAHVFYGVEVNNEVRKMGRGGCLVFKWRV